MLKYTKTFYALTLALFISAFPMTASAMYHLTLSDDFEHWVIQVNGVTIFTCNKDNAINIVEATGGNCIKEFMATHPGPSKKYKK
jgi:hypothetical protein